ncbi:hypothetical protein H0920_10605 [Acinetobacter sp. C_4_1]|uniref:hypothetical protein n=1 Tax=unclassified Acinetobacter TaxID=196816 RepID=UPI0021B73972|nr:MULTISPECIES: hypothetical protein [unclassified Acinetobacter]MCT8090722.1 hypothetical protein [Acinetobacter sp. F_3_1]MCT8101546.1 hypothetical protein [Acinetobacter sp. C_4_1]MCT8135119.1 hypothetical protein [Acinetobacter sp. T_3_1]
MSTKLGTLTLDLVAKIGNFTGPIKDAEKQTKLSFDNMRNHVNNYGAVAVAGAAAVGAGVFAMANEYANAARELQIFASISNTTTQEFQRMAVGAQTMGISQEKLADQLKDFNEKLGEFITIGSGGAVDFFEQIAIKTEGSAEGARKLALEMQNLSGPKALQLYVDKLEEAGVTQQQMSFYLESMASDTTNLIPLLKDGGKGFEYWADAAERAGVIMDESAIAKAAELRVQMDLLKLQVEGAKNQFIQGLMPALVSVGDGLSDATMETNLMADAGETLGEVFKGVAAVGMGVYAVVKMLSNAIAGLAHTAVEAKNNVDLAAQGGSWADKLPGIKLGKALITGSLLANAPNSGVAMAAQDNAKVADDVGTAISRIYNDAVNQSVSAMAKIQNSQAGVTKGSDEWIKKQNEAAKAASGVNKELQEQERLLEQQKRDREQISKAYSTDFESINANEQEDLQRILGAGFTSADQAKFTDLAKMRFEGERAEYFKSLNLELNQYKWTEEKKLEYAYQQDKQIAENDIRFSGVVKEAKLKFLDEQYALELRKTRWHALEMQQAMQESIQGLSYGADDIFARATMAAGEYALWSAENDRSNAQVSLKKQRVGVEQDIMTSDLYSTDDERYEALLEAHKEYRDGMAAIDVEYAEQVKELDAQQYNDSMNMYAALLSQAGAVWGDMTQMVKDSAGESSSAYKSMFLAQQMFAIGSALVSTHLAATQAMAAPDMMLFGQKIAASEAITAMGYANVGLIAGQTIAGMAHDGIDNIPKEGTWLLDKGERVVDSRTNADLKNYLADGGGSKAPNVNVYTLPGQTADVSMNSDGSLDVRIRKIAGEYLNGQLSNPNSQTSKNMKQNFNVAQRR